MHLGEFEKAVIRHALKCSGPALHAARSALRHLERAWALSDEFPEIAVFCGITAEEESATAIFHSLKRRGYSGAEGLRSRDHVDKGALHPFLLAIGRAINESLNQYSPKLEFNSELSPDKAERLRIRLSIPWRDGSEKWAYPFPPLHFGVSVNGIPQDFSRELHQIASEKKIRSVWEYVQRLANRRNQVLYASSNGIPQWNGSAEKFIRYRQSVVFSHLMALLMIDPYKERQQFVQQALSAFLKLLVPLHRKIKQ